MPEINLAKAFRKFPELQKSFGYITGDTCDVLSLMPEDSDVQSWASFKYLIMWIALGKAKITVSNKEIKNLVTYIRGTIKDMNKDLQISDEKKRTWGSDEEIKANILNLSKIMVFWQSQLEN